ncbi:PIG-L deacetylase family protein [Parerythrobacter aestuarii]|uniref:PIG-L deacetylase family protein n=1 Tax=Parerythrobacter aestuarii TaxID=3020909 RepID=UPI0024DEC949|nr:PIG-L family deacetylase [Parerythrobacter aestuarii]
MTNEQVLQSVLGLTAGPLGLRVLAVSPHPDDVALSAGGLLWNLHRSSTIGLLTVFGRSRWISHNAVNQVKDVEAVTALRRREDMKYARQLAADCDVLPFEDTSLRNYDDVGEREQSHDPASWREQIKASLHGRVMQFRPDLVIGPAGIGNHIDHVIVSDAINELRQVPGLAVLFYQDLPYAAEHDWQSATPDRFAIAGTLDIDIEAALDEKIRNLGVYESQIDNNLRSCVKNHARKLGNGLAVERYWVRK